MGVDTSWISKFPSRILLNCGMPSCSCVLISCSGFSCATGCGHSICLSTWAFSVAKSAVCCAFRECWFLRGRECGSVQKKRGISPDRHYLSSSIPLRLLQHLAAAFPEELTWVVPVRLRLLALRFPAPCQ